MGKRILIASYTFPPYAGIGGRRWAKFAKFLVKKGHEVQVVHAETDKPKGSLWNKDVEGIATKTFPSNYPVILEVVPSSIIEKLQYRRALRKVKKASQGSPYDRALLDRESFLRRMCVSIDSFNPEYLVVTGGPFLLLKYTLDLIQDFPRIKFVADFRDPWTWGEAFGYKYLTGKRLQFEQDTEKSVCEKFDLITTPSEEIKHRLQKKYPDSGDKIHVLSHGFDMDDLGEDVVPNGDGGYLIYGGNVYQGAEEELVEIARVAFQKMGIETKVYTSSVNIRSNAEGLTVLPSIPPNQFYQKVKESKAVLFPIRENFKDGVSTKLFEFAACQKPIIAFGLGGELSRLIEEKGLGRFLESPELIVECINDLSATESNWYLNFEFSKVTDQLLNLLEAP